MLEGQTGCLVLLPLPAHADADVEAAAREHVDRRRRLRQGDRPAQGSEEDVGPEPHPRGHRRQMGDGRQRIEPEPVGTGWLASTPGAAVGGVTVRLEILAEHHVIGGHQPVDPRVVGGAGELDELRPIVVILGGPGPQGG